MGMSKYRVCMRVHMGFWEGRCKKRCLLNPVSIKTASAVINIIFDEELFDFFVKGDKTSECIRSTDSR